MKFIFEDRDGDETYKGWKYPPKTKPMEFSSLEEFVKWSMKVGLPRHEFVPPNTPGSPYFNDTPYWMVYCQGGYD